MKTLETHLADCKSSYEILKCSYGMEVAMSIITATQLKNSLGAYLEEAKNGETIIITKDGKEICELRPRTESKLALFDSLTGIASTVDGEIAHEERVSKL